MGWLNDPAYRKSRLDWSLPSSPGLYALFAKSSNVLPGFSVSIDQPIYIGKASGARGLAGRCHFRGGTSTHSPRRSLAAILREPLGLRPTRVNRPDGSYKSWGLDGDSEVLLNQWMHANLLLAIELFSRPREIERELIARYSPLLNLEDCEQSVEHVRIATARKIIADSLR